MDKKDDLCDPKERDLSSIDKEVDRKKYRYNIKITEYRRTGM